jgi:hypothetical protein
MPLFWTIVFAVTLVAGIASAQGSGAEPPAEPAAARPAAAGDSDPETLLADPTSASAQRTQLNLLGEVDSSAGEGRRNENVSLTLIDNNVLKELNTRLGTTATVIQIFDVERSFFGKEFGGDPAEPLHVPQSMPRSLHGELFWSHSNSTLSARSFFQAGKVQPARTNDYGFVVTLPLGEKTGLTVDASQRRLRGQVNGNVLVPAADERVPTAADPATRAAVQTLLDAFGSELPNRTDIDPRALNTNSPQNIDNDRAAITLDRGFGEADRLTARYGVTLQNVDAFQLVDSQNPNTTTKNHEARLTWSRSWTSLTTTDFSAGFDRIGSLLVTEDNSLASVYQFGRLLESLGAGSEIPIDRAQNLFKYAGRVQRIQGNHTWKTGFSLLRRQVNGSEAMDHRGSFSFRTDFGRSITDNLLAGAASEFRGAIGDPHRGYRNWDLKFFAGDDWRVNSRLNLNLGLRYEPVTRPIEVNGLSSVPYGCDCNNLAPSFGFAYRASDTWGVLRGAYGIHYGEIFPATFMETRYNAPGVVAVAIQKPDLVNPWQGLNEADLSGDVRSTLFRIDPELSSPYSHQYNFSWQLQPYRDWGLELGYVGSRSPKLFQQWYLNRGQPVEGIPLTTATVNDRRADQRYFDVLHILNGSRGYYDAAKVDLRIPQWAGLSLTASYWFSKAIDLGSSYTNTGTGRDGRQGRSPSEFEVHSLLRGPSDFHQAHAALWNVNYETPALTQAPRWLGMLFGSWQFNSAVLAKSGTPFSVRTADGPGNGNVDGAGTDRPNLLDPTVLGVSADHPDTSAARLPITAFGPVQPGELTGNLGNNTFRKDGIFNVNAALSRRFLLGADRALVFQVESLNFTNHPQFEEPGIDISGSNFGRITNTLNDGRAFRFTLRLSL